MANPSAPEHQAAPTGRRFDREAGPQAPEPIETRRERIRVLAGLGVIAGIWLIIAPFVLSYGDGDPTWNDVVFGAAVVVLSALRMTVIRGTQWAGWLMALAGAWIFASAFWLDDTSTASWNNIILGIVVFVLGVAASEPIRRRS
jgi:hypothetical protein